MAEFYTVPTFIKYPFFTLTAPAAGYYSKLLPFSYANKINYNTENFNRTNNTINVYQFYTKHF